MAVAAGSAERCQQNKFTLLNMRSYAKRDCGVSSISVDQNCKDLKTAVANGASKASEIALDINAHGARSMPLSSDKGDRHSPKN